jgi:hypothetical protein
MAMMNDKHEVGKCDICHKEMTHIGCHGYIHGINEITRYCDECWEKEQGKQASEI